MWHRRCSTSTCPTSASGSTAAIPRHSQSLGHRDPPRSGIEGADRVEMSLANAGLRWLDHPLFAVDIAASPRSAIVPDGLEAVFFGEITGIRAAFPSARHALGDRGRPRLPAAPDDGTKDRGFQVSFRCVGRFPIPDDLIAVGVSAENLLVPVPDPIGAVVTFLKLLVAYLTVRSTRSTPCGSRTARATSTSSRRSPPRTAGR